MEQTLRIESVSRGGLAYLRLYGPINETFAADALLQAATGRHVIINLKAVNRLTSFGVREWVRAMQALSQRIERLVLVECSPMIVAQLNTISNFAASATVASVRLPYICDKCEWDTEVTYALKGQPEHTPEAPPVTCKRCSAVIKQPDEDLETYLGFAENVSSKPLDPEVAAFIKDFAEAIDKPGRPVQSEEKVPSRLLMTTQSIVIRIPNLGKAITGTARSRWRWLLEHPRVTLGALGVLLAAALVVVTLELAPVGLPPEQLAAFNDHLQADRFAEAEALVAQFQAAGAVTPALERQLQEQIETGRKQFLRRNRQEMPELLVARRYAEVVAAAERAAQVAPLDADGVFVVAEAHRNLSQWSQAEAFYTQFSDMIAESNPDDPRLDDALFWKAEAMLATGQVKPARKLFRVLAFEMPDSEFKRQARQRLRTMARTAPSKPATP